MRAITPGFGEIETRGPEKLVASLDVSAHLLELRGLGSGTLGGPHSAEELV